MKALGGVDNVPIWKAVDHIPRSDAGMASASTNQPVVEDSIGPGKLDRRWCSRVDAERALSAGRRLSGLPVNVVSPSALLFDDSLQIERQWLAILVADIAGFSRLIELEDLATALRLRHLRQHLIIPTMQAYGGRVVNVAGDGTLTAFACSVDAVECAVAVQRALNCIEQETAVERRIQLHMGISGGESVAIDGELFGHALNVASRLQALAEPGDVYLSEEVFHQVNDMISVRFEEFGKCYLRNMAVPVCVYRVARNELY